MAFKVFSTLLLVLTFALATQASFLGRRDEDRQCRMLRTDLQRCDQDQPSRECCRKAREFVEEQQCSPRRGLPMEILDECRRQGRRDDLQDGRQEQQCRILRSELQRCDQQEPSRKCCRKAREYVQEQQCSPRRGLPQDIMDQCRRQETRRDDVENYRGQEQQCRTLRSELQRCDQQEPSRECCRKAREYVQEQQCSPRRGLPQDIMDQCRRQESRRDDVEDYRGQEQQCRSLRSELQRCDQQEPSRECCRKAREFVQEQQCSPREGRPQDIMDQCRRQQRDSMDDESRRGRDEGRRGRRGEGFLRSFGGGWL